MSAEFATGIDRACAAERSTHRRGAVGHLDEQRKGPPRPVNSPQTSDVAASVGFPQSGNCETHIRRSGYGSQSAKRAQSAPLKAISPARGRHWGNDQANNKRKTNES